MKTILHFLVIMVSAPIWTFTMCFFVIACGLSLIAMKIDPNITRGNCWLYALPLFIKYGGYLAVRAADGNKFLNLFMIPHVLYMPTLNRGSVISQYVPINRKSSFWVPWHALYYRGKIRHVEANHNAKQTNESI